MGKKIVYLQGLAEKLDDFKLKRKSILFFLCGFITKIIHIEKSNKI
jgi:hypothetical protein